MAISKPFTAPRILYQRAYTSALPCLAGSGCVAGENLAGPRPVATQSSGTSASLPEETGSRSVCREPQQCAAASPASDPRNRHPQAGRLPKPWCQPSWPTDAALDLPVRVYRRSRGQYRHQRRPAHTRQCAPDLPQCSGPKNTGASRIETGWGEPYHTSFEVNLVVYRAGYSNTSCFRWIARRISSSGTFWPFVMPCERTTTSCPLKKYRTRYGTRWCEGGSWWMLSRNEPATG